MRIVLDTDLEGAAGVFSQEMCFRGDPLFEAAYAELARDINAAVEGAFAGGADEVVALDGHGEQGLDLGLLDPRAITGGYGLLEQGFDAMFCIGCHAMAGTRNAFLDHTQSSTTWFRYQVNGRETGEIGQSAMQAAHYGAPVILVTGDEAAVAEARDFLGEVECVAVKRGIGRNRCVLYGAQDCRAEIRAAAKRAVENLRADRERYPLYRPGLPAELLLTFTRSDYADQAVHCNREWERVGPRTVRRLTGSYLELYP